MYLLCIVMMSSDEDDGYEDEFSHEDNCSYKDEDRYTDEYSYCSYEIQLYQAGQGPPLIKKISRLIAAVVQNEVEVLRELFTSRKWYNVKDVQGYNLLQIAVLQSNKEVFDYMLSIPNFPINCRGIYNVSALGLSLDDMYFDDEYFPLVLLEKGASINYPFVNGSPLHGALTQSFNNVALELIKRGADVNAHDHLIDHHSAIYWALCMKVSAAEQTEVVMTLLGEGAIPFGKEEFECSVIEDLPLFIQEILFLHSIDQYSELDFHILLKLARSKSPLFHQIVKCSYKVVGHVNSLIDLCMTETDYLEIIVEKFGTCLAEFELCRNRDHPSQDFREKCAVERLDILLKSGFQFDVIYSSDSFGHLFCYLYNLRYEDESYVSEVYLYFLSYGLVLREQDLQFVYEKFGYCELFKLLLHMDYEQDTETDTGDIMAVFIYDVNMDLQKFITSPKNFCLSSVHKLFDYFAHPGLTQHYYQFTNEWIVKRDIPSLLELARNSCRKHLIDRYNIQTTSKFYTVLKHMPINNVYKKIISYEIKLY